jgi:small subunit ribosomal protein S16
MLMMRLQRVGRKNDPSFRIVVTDKRTGVKSDKHVDRLGSYNPKMNHVQIDADKAKDWLSKGVQPSDTVHNILVGQGIVEGKKRNVLPKKSPIIDEEAIKKAEEEAAAKAEADAKATEAEAAAESTEEAPVETAEAETAESPATEDDGTVDVVADEDDPEEGGEIAEESDEEKKKEESEHAKAKADAEGD